MIKQIKFQIINKTIRKILFKNYKIVIHRVFFLSIIKIILKIITNLILDKIIIRIPKLKIKLKIYNSFKNNKTLIYKNLYKKRLR